MRIHPINLAVTGALLLASSLVWTGCDGLLNTARKQRINLLEGSSWSVQNISTRAGEVHDVAVKGFAIAFVDLMRFSGHASCNIIEGRYDTYSDGSFAATVDRATDHDCERASLGALQEALERADRFEREGASLRLYHRSSLVVQLQRLTP
jgi:hypothetical protein